MIAFAQVAVPKPQPLDWANGLSWVRALEAYLSAARQPWEKYEVPGRVSYVCGQRSLSIFQKGNVALRIRGYFVAMRDGGRLTHVADTAEPASVARVSARWLVGERE